ncbi:MAG: hypothetical protein HUU26_02220 [Gemmatimonadaceae bacterium]|nr:hypothetical protein [Gemmatimonadaceae bacterium]
MSLLQSVSVLLALLAPVLAGAQGIQRPGRDAGAGIVVGLEYALLDNLRLVRGMADAFAETGMPGMKHYVEAVQWGEMQSGPNAPIVFTKFDWFVAEYQRAGFTELTISLKPHSQWASKQVGRLRSTNAAPKPEFREDFSRWVQAVVERYDGDGVDDMPGLRWPVRHVEIGNEFSSYQPEPVDEYLATLKLAYAAAHRAFPQVMVGHAAFLLTPVNMNVADPRDYDTVWRTTRIVDKTHGLADIRKVLDHPELFDVINLHNLGDPYEIEHLMRWLKYETGQRGYTKPVIISDTMPTSYAGWGGATVCRGLALAVMIPPAREADRCRLAEYFTKMVNGDRTTVAWTRGFVAADHVQRVVIAAEQGIKLINLSFVADIGFATTKAFRAGSGIGAWGGALRVDYNSGRVLERYPLYYAIGQLMGYLRDSRSVTRVPMPDPRSRVYRIDRPAGPVIVAWRDPQGVLLPGDGAPATEADVPATGRQATVEAVITSVGQTEPGRTTHEVNGGQVRIRLTHTPVFVSSR